MSNSVDCNKEMYMYNNTKLLTCFCFHVFDVNRVDTQEAVLFYVVTLLFPHLTHLLSQQILAQSVCCTMYSVELLFF